MRIHMKVCLAVVAAIAFVIPAWAAHEMSAPVSLDNTATIGNTTLKPGSYRVVVSPNTDDVKVMQNGRVVATATGKWITLKNKSPYTDVVITKNQIQEIDFSGKTQAIRLD